MEFFIVLLILAYCLSTAFSIVLLGDRKLIAHDLFQLKNVLSLVFNWKFIVSMTLAIIARITFTLINNMLLKIPHLAGAATTVSVFITLLSIVFILVANHFFLGETLNIKQGIGAFIVMVGIVIMIK